MPLLHILLVAIIQGVTEFLPVSSSGHLILLPNLLGLEDQGQAIDVAVHVGTLGAVVLFFWSDVKLAILGVPRLLAGKRDTEGATLAFLLLIATVPVVIAGFILKITGLDEVMRSITVIGWTMLLFGIVLWWADQTGASEKSDGNWNLRDAIIMGLWQAIALIPGTSRSGIAITGARRLGYDRTSAAKLAMLMSIPTILASGGLLTLQVAGEADIQTAKDGAFAAVFSLLAALLALKIMMRLLQSISYTPYVIYRIILGCTLLAIAYS
ncbi:undecaprenyl-diphosphate phosphatase [Shimia abyssi]|uniref:Undecaprenyl-diphosphatase n=1 Tax=Shimia abyssi TaxID=1662395 RepID=A0A2P8F4G0_9RHOB|nr:undecaprenyl-diphosphate phosphatase [Shimia abyssi]PSL16598.1 undecaprenyl-diphosphatase [Shimia abyssi]